MHDWIIRDVIPANYKEIEDIHLQTKVDYKFPDLNKFIIKKVAEKEGKISMASAILSIGEIYLWLDRSGEKASELFDVELVLKDEMFMEAKRKGIQEIVCWVPQHIEQHFAKRLDDLGFDPARDGWRCWSKIL